MIYMFHIQNLYLFFIASLLLNLAPGNDMIYVASRSISQGIKAGIISALGVFIGCFVHILAAVFGLSIIIMQSTLLFEIIKLLGAAYLIYLGVKAFVNKSDFNNDIATLPKVNTWKLLKQGIITNALNPKVALFFLSFLPQFIQISSPLYKAQLFSLGLWFDLQGTLVLMIVAFLLGKTSKLIKQNKKFWRIQGKVTGLILIGLGIKVALSSKR
jgi:threonine/homoserine/homoserine lactone efflux protein